MKIIGHRGARGLAPENTLLSVGHALDHHVDEVEFDVRVTNDGVPMLSHNSFITAASEQLAIHSHTFDELHSYKPDLTSLHGALGLIDTKCRVHIEVKPDEPVAPIVAVINEYLASGMYSASDFILASRSQTTLTLLHEQLPNIELCVIEIWSSWRAHRRAKALGIRRISLLENWLYPGFIRAMKRRGYQLCAYPPTNEVKKRRFARLGLTGCSENPAKAARWAKAGLYGVFTDYPDLFRHKNNHL